jgi:hypothetical protein
MGFSARILADSLSPRGVRLTTFELTFPRIILAEFNTHRVFSRNSASSRAIPVEKMLRMVDDDPYIPSHWGKNQKGMQAEAELTAEEQDLARRQWLLARDSAMAHAKIMLEIGLHKQLTNRLLEPFMWHTVIVSSTEWSNCWHLRDNEAAHPEIRRSIHAARELYESNTPMPLAYGEWHLPLVIGVDVFADGAGRWNMNDPAGHLRFSPTDPANVGPFVVNGAPSQEVDWDRLAKISVARCGRVSYLTHDGRRDFAEDLGLYGRLVAPGHMSPLEHAARPLKIEPDYAAIAANPERVDAPADTKFRSVYFKDRQWWCGNFRGWMQHRGAIPGEDDILGHRTT